MRTEKLIRTLRVNLLDEDKAKLGQELAQILGDIDETTQDMKAYLAEKKGHIESLIAQKQCMVLTLNRGYEFKDVECMSERYFASNEVKVVRTDTWEVIEVRAMTGEERQTELDLMDVEKAQAEIEEDLGRAEEGQADLQKKEGGNVPTVFDPLQTELPPKKSGKKSA